MQYVMQITSVFNLLHLIRRPKQILKQIFLYCWANKKFYIPYLFIKEYLHFCSKAKIAHWYNMNFHTLIFNYKLKILNVISILVQRPDEGRKSDRNV
jgi:hypothetical protein